MFFLVRSHCVPSDVTLDELGVPEWCGARRGVHCTHIECALVPLLGISSLSYEAKRSDAGG